MPAAAQGVFGSRLALAEQYAAWLADAGVVRGLIGPREVPRLWERHILNSATVAAHVPEGVTVCDIGSGAGLPGLVLAVARPDVRVTLVEPLLRRTTFLDEVVADLGLAEQVEVLRGRADELHRSRTFDVVTSRAVAPLPKLLGWSMPLVAAGGCLLAMKGSSAAQEVEECRDLLAWNGCAPPELLEVDGTTLVRVSWPGQPPVGWRTSPTPRERGAFAGTSPSRKGRSRRNR